MLLYAQFAVSDDIQKLFVLFHVKIAHVGMLVERTQHVENLAVLANLDLTLQIQVVKPVLDVLLASEQRLQLCLNVEIAHLVQQVVGNKVQHVKYVSMDNTLKV